MWFLLTLHFRHRARHEVRKMKFGVIVLRKDEASGMKHRKVLFSLLFITKENQKMGFGKNKIGLFLSSTTKNLPLSTNGKFTNQSVRKTCIKTLLDSGVSHNNVAQLSGHKSLKSLDSYAVASHQQQRQMSKILSGKENSRLKPKADSAEEKPQNQSSGTVQESIQTNGIFLGASIGVINIQNLVLPEASGSKHAVEISAPQKRRRHVMESSDEEDY